MAKWADVYELARQGVAAGEIMARLRLKPYRFRQILDCQYLAKRLAADQELLERMGGYHAAAQTPAAARRLGELIGAADYPETARKSCMAILALAGLPEKGQEEENGRQQARGNRQQGAVGFSPGAEAKPHTEESPSPYPLPSRERSEEATKTGRTAIPLSSHTGQSRKMVCRQTAPAHPTIPTMPPAIPPRSQAEPKTPTLAPMGDGNVPEFSELFRTLTLPSE
jgi:hypothetical protein